MPLNKETNHWNCQKCQEICGNHLRFLNERSKPENQAWIAPSTAALTKLKRMWWIKNIFLISKLKLMRTLIIPIFLFAYDSRTLSADTQRFVEALEMRCSRKILNMSCRDHITNEDCPVGWDCRIHWLHLCRGVRPLPTSVLDMTLNNLMVRFQ